MTDELEQSGDGDGGAGRQLADRLKKLREYLGMSQQHVADCTGITRSAISDIERGQRRVDAVELTKLARLYQHPVELAARRRRAGHSGHACACAVHSQVQPPH